MGLSNDVKSRAKKQVQYVYCHGQSIKTIIALVLMNKVAFRRNVLSTQQVLASETPH